MCTLLSSTSVTRMLFPPQVTFLARPTMRRNLICAAACRAASKSNAPWNFICLCLSVCTYEFIDVGRGASLFQRGCSGVTPLCPNSTQFLLFHQEHLSASTSHVSKFCGASGLRLLLGHRLKAWIRPSYCCPKELFVKNSASFTPLSGSYLRLSSLCSPQSLPCIFPRFKNFDELSGIPQEGRSSPRQLCNNTKDFPGKRHLAPVPDGKATPGNIRPNTFQSHTGLCTFFKTEATHTNGNFSTNHTISFSDVRIMRTVFVTLKKPVELSTSWESDENFFKPRTRESVSTQTDFLISVVCMRSRSFHSTGSYSMFYSQICIVSLTVARNTAE